MSNSVVRSQQSEPVILNLGCGTRTSAVCVNIDWSMPLRLHRSKIGQSLASLILTGPRLEQFRAISGPVVVHDLRRGIPAEDSTVDAVYHSHVFEHIDRQHVATFLREVRRVLKPGGIHRIVVPDLEQIASRYLKHLQECVDGKGSDAEHDSFVSVLVEQMVRREAYGTSQQPPVRRFFENALFGDARRRGETHQWMWDRVNLSEVLTAAGFHDVNVVDNITSSIPGWANIKLDVGAGGGEYKPGSLYIEAAR